MMRFLAVCVALWVAGASAQQVRPPPAIAQQQVSIKNYGAIGDDTCHPLSSFYRSLAAATRVYPFVSDLTQCIDWAATQQTINVAYSLGGNNSSEVFCPLGNYSLSNPIFFDSAHNSQGSFPAWAAGTTYANSAQVTYNGIPWASQGSGNVGNPPTSSNLFPATLQWNSNDTFPIKAVTISNASPAVITIPASQGGAGTVSANMPLVFMTQQYAVPPSGAAPALPTGLNLNQVYYVVASSISRNSFSVSATPGGTAIRTSSAGVGVFFVNSQVWQVAPVVNSSGFSNRVSFVGDEGLTGNSGCRFQSTSMWMNGTIYIGPQNGVLVKNINVQHQTGGGTTPPYRCNRWRGVTPTTFFQLHAGFVQMDNGGGSSRTLYENSGAAGFFTDHAVGYASGQLSDSNTWIKSTFSDACIGVEFMETQAFINSMYDNTISNTTTSVRGDLSEGVRIVGGNYSNAQGIANAFTISGVSIGGNQTLTATLSSPDRYLLAPMCAFNAGFAFYSQEPHYGNSVPLGNSCAYNVFTIVTPHNGIVPFYIGAFNPITNVITLVLIPAWANPYVGTYGIPSEITSATTLYAAEMGTAFFGQVQVDTVHVENPAIPTTLLCNCGGFGSARIPELKHVFLNSTASMGTNICCNQTPSNALKAQFYATQTVPFITAWTGDVIIDSLVGGSDLPYGLQQYDRVLIGAETNMYIEGRHMAGNKQGNNAPAFQFQTDYQGVFSSVGGFVNRQLSGGYFALNGGAFGGGTWDTNFPFASYAQYSGDVGGTGEQVDIADFWRTQGWGASPQWGLRPAPYMNPCILPSQATTLSGALPAITYKSQLRQNPTVTAGGVGYNVNDTITLAGGTFSPAAVLRVTATGAGGSVTAVTVGNSGIYTVEPTSFTQGSTSGGGTGATFGKPIWYVNYYIPYPILWGGQTYRLCDYKGNSAWNRSPGHNLWVSANTGYSYFQNLTTTNVPNLSWMMDGGSPFVYLNQEALELMFPGLNIQLTPDGTGRCAASMESFQVLEVHPTMGYIKIVRADSDGGPFLPQWGGGNTCKNTIIGQQAPNLFNPVN